LLISYVDGRITNGFECSLMSAYAFYNYIKEDNVKKKHVTKSILLVAFCTLLLWPSIASADTCPSAYTLTNGNYIAPALLQNGGGFYQTYTGPCVPPAYQAGNFCVTPVPAPTGYVLVPPATTTSYSNIGNLYCPAGFTNINPATTGPTDFCICNVPEMSDSLALAFIFVAGGMIYWLQRRSHA
jgi:hypothetical protein